jgi:hypothetical protein
MQRHMNKMHNTVVVVSEKKLPKLIQSSSSKITADERENSTDNSEKLMNDANNERLLITPTY